MPSSGNQTSQPSRSAGDNHLLIRMNDPRKELSHTQTFVALDVKSSSGRQPYRFVGTVIGFTDDGVSLDSALSHLTFHFLWTYIEAAYWAPMGYRA